MVGIFKNEKNCLRLLTWLNRLTSLAFDNFGKKLVHVKLVQPFKSSFPFAGDDMFDPIVA